MIDRKKITKIVYYVLLALIIIVGVFTRVYQYPNNPPGLNQDEASIAYDVYAVANYGVDRNGDSFPVHFLGWGNGQSAFYGYLVMPFVKIFGFSPATTRMGNLLMGILAILILFLLFKIIGNFELGLIAAFIYAISPWGIMLSKWGPEASSLPFVLLIAVYLYAKSYKNPVYLPISFVVFGFSLYSYATAYFFTPIFLLFLIYYARHFFSDTKQYLKYMGYSLGAFIVVSIPIGLWVLINIVFKEASAFKLLGITITKLVDTGVRFQKFVFLDSQVFNFQWLYSQLVMNWKYFYETVFLQGGSPLNVLEGYGNYFHFSNYFLFSGMAIALYDSIIACRKKQFSLDTVIIFWFIFASMLGILMETNPFRVNAIFFPLFHFIAKGVYKLGEVIYLGIRMLKFNIPKVVARLSQISVYIIIAAIYLCSFIPFYKQYSTEYANRMGLWFRDSFQQAFEYAESVRDKNENLYVADYDPPTIYVYVLYYGKIDPRFFNKNVVYMNPNDEWRPVKEFGPYKFIYSELELQNPDEKGVYIVFNEYVKSFPTRPNAVVRNFRFYTVYSF